MKDEVAERLSELTEPAVPANFKATVMARIAREAEARSVVAVAPVRREGWSWLWAVIGAGLMFAATWWGWSSVGSWPDVLAPRIGGGTSVMPSGLTATVATALALLVYLAGLFAPLRSRNRG